jgi:hypothetical protein
MTRPTVACGSAPVAYLNSSALVDLITQEPDTAALRVGLARWPSHVSSRLAAISLTRTARRLGDGATRLAPRVLAGLRLLAIHPLVPMAAQIGGTLLRSLDAIHLATAASLRAEHGVLSSMTDACSAWRTASACRSPPRRRRTARDNICDTFQIVRYGGPLVRSARR